MNAEASAAGFASGYESGLRDGACEYLVRHLQPPAPLKRDSRVLYIPQGFEGIDQGIIEALRLTVREVYVADATRMAEQAALIRPDWVLVLNGLHVFPANHLQQVDTVRSLGIRTAIWFADDPYVTAETMYIAPRYDVVLTHELSTMQMYRERGCTKVVYMPLGVDHNRFKPMAVEEKYRSDVCFIGQAFWNRVEIFDALVPYLKTRKVFIAGGLWERMKRFKEMERFIRLGWLPVEETVKHYNGARVVINLHRTTEAGKDNKNVLNLPGRSINPRTYEILACGTMQLTDQREDLPHYFVPGLELDTYANTVELRNKLEFYLTHEEERRTMALRGLRRTLNDHSYLRRLQQIGEVLGW
ncbi:glycosyltransferase [Paenibacillus sacheonensis]|uniref:Glycosyltransferase n=2 Tax=Paenibacillus sacheonensis TaxID=742054 RepID=A0A7X4YSJ9_9BACL|nr:glycosyltransferase [Paenibacillus sacheonensis]NBC71710.1 glycosyltransferase [Paenibacillus sacheonensis]